MQLTIEARLTRLERSNRRLRFALTSTLVVGAAALLTAQAPPQAHEKKVVADRIETKFLAVLNDRGEPRIMLAMDEKGESGNVIVSGPAGGTLSLSSGDNSVTIAANPDECQIESKGRQRIDLIAPSSRLQYVALPEDTFLDWAPDAGFGFLSARMGKSWSLRARDPETRKEVFSFLPQLDGYPQATISDQNGTTVLRFPTPPKSP